MARVLHPRQRKSGIRRQAADGAVIFTTRYRPVRGSRGYYRVNIRHGVSTVKSGERYTLGIIFHDAK